MIEKADRIYFYGAGCVSNETNNRIAEQLSLYNTNALQEIASDMLGAARALFGNSSGIACILGTGSNSCAYSDGIIQKNISPLGYILGDEGGGAALGKRLVKAVLREEITDSAILSDFREAAGGGIAQVLQHVYRLPGANSYLASLCPILSKHRNHPEVARIIREEFASFFANCIARYDLRHYDSIGFIGSLAKAFEAELAELSEEHGLTGFTVAQSPMNGLINYHSKN